MEMMKRLAAGILCLLLFLSLLPVSALGATDAGGWVYEIADGEATVTGYSGSAAVLTVPDTLGGSPVTGIARSAFSGKTALTTLYLPSGIRSIGSGAFSGCSSLTSVRVESLSDWCAIRFENASANPLSTGTVSLFRHNYGTGSYQLVTDLSTLNWWDSIGAYAFTNYKRLTSARLPYGTETVGESAFSGCTALTEAEFPGGLTGIGASAFSGCSALTEAELPEGLLSIGASAFSGCGKLARLVFPATVETVGTNAFSGCKITDVYLDDLKSWCGIPFPNAGSNPLNGASNLYVRDIPVTDLVLPEGVESIGSYAFYGFKGLRGVILPEGVSVVNTAAFQNCTALETVLIPVSMVSIARDAFASCTGLSDICFTGSRNEWEAVGNYDTFTAAVHYDTPKLSVSFYPDSAPCSSMTTAALGERAYVLPACSMVAPVGKKFKAWEIGGEEFAEGNVFIPNDYADEAGSIAVTAKWTDITYTVSFDAGDGSGGMAPATVVYGNTYTLPACSFTAPEGKKFMAWRIDGGEYAAGSGYTPRRDVTATALWTDITYTISFDAGGGSGSMANMTAVYGREFSLPDCTFEAPEGLAFKGWQPGDAEEPLPEGGSFIAAGDTTVTAIWDERLTVSFDPGEGTGSMEDIPVAMGNSVKLPDCGFTAPEGKGFWRWQIGETEYRPGDSYTVSENTTATAVWKNIYTVTFDPAGGSGSMENLTGLDGETITLPPCGFQAPADKGSFKAWKIGEMEYLPGNHFTLRGNTTATAVWREIYTVTFDPGEGAGAIAPRTVEENAAQPLPDCTFTAPEGKGFKAWIIGETEYAENAFFTVTEDTTVTAVWSELREVRYDSGAGTGALAPVSVPAGTLLTLPSETVFTPPGGHYFKAWLIGEAEYAAGAAVTVEEDTTVTALWVSMYSVIFNGGGGGGSMGAQVVRRGDAVTLPANGFNAPSGCVFEAWEIDGVKYPIGASYTPTGDTRITAVWNSLYECSVSTGETTVTKYKGSESAVTVPELLGGYPVTGISAAAFSGCTSPVRVTIPEGVRSIGERAFIDCSKMVRVDLPASLEQVGANAFSGCTELTGAYITDLTAWCAVSFANAAANPLSISKNLYLDGKLVTELSIPAGVTAIGSYAFYGFANLKKLNSLPASVTAIGNSAFYGCTGLTNIAAFPEGLKSIGSSAFYGCTGLTNIGGFPASLTAIGANAFSSCTSLGTVVLPSRLTQVAEGLFSGCTGLKDVTIPPSVTDMGQNAFSGCRIDVVRVSDLARWCKINFANAASNPLNGAQSLYVRSAPVTDLTIQDEITSVSNFAFYGFLGLKCVIIPQNAAIIYRNAFTNCSNLEYILLPVGLQSLGDNAFSNCGKLTDVYYTGDEARWAQELPNYQQLVSSGVTVHYNARQITVTLEPGEGAGTPEQTSAIVGRPYVLTEPSFTAPAGKSFNAWKIGEQEYLRGQSFTPEENTTATALWGDIVYQLSFAANGGSGSMDTLYANEGDALVLPECAFTPPTGKQFRAWLLGDGEYAPGESISPTKDIHALAVWEPLVCVVSFEPGEGSGSMEAITTTYQVAVTLPECAFEAPEGKIFYRWDVNGTGRAPGFSLRPAASVTVTAVWKDIRCTVSFEAGGGEGSMGSKTVVYGSEYTLPRCSFTAPSGQGFRAWEMDGVRYAVGDIITVKADTVLTAIWADQLQITFDPGEGSGSMSARTLIEGDALILPSCSFRIPKTGMQFRCWEIGGREYAPGDSVTPASAVTVTALWEPVPCVMTFDSGDGQTMTETGSYGYEFVLPECTFDPPVDLYFKTWKQGSREYAPGDAVTPTGNMTFTAVWTGLYLYTVDSGRTTITAYNGNETELTIPRLLGGYPVAGIGAAAFAGNTALTSITIPDGVTSIGTGAFSGCSSLARVRMPEGLLSIESRAFYNCAKLESAAIPDSVTAIGSQAFYGCKSMTTVKMPGSLRSVGSGAFQSCTELTGVYITDLEGWCAVSFADAYSNPLTTAKNLYLNGNAVERLTFPDASELTAIGDYAFNNCEWLTGVSLPESLRSIGSYAFSGCIRLEEITLPKNVTGLGSYAFNSCRALKSAALPEGLAAIPDYAFSGCASLAKMTLPTSVTAIGASAFNGCSGMTELSVPAGVTEIKSGAFNACTGLVSVYITDLAAWCAVSFAGATSNPLYYAKELIYRGIPITDLTIQDNIGVIRSYAFNHFQGLRCVIIPQKATAVLQNSFTNCSNLEYILLPEGMESLGDGAFNNCSKLTDVYFTGTEAQWKNLPNYRQFVKDGITVHYNAEKITITFAAEDGAGTREETSAISGRPYVLTGCPFTHPEGKVFASWSIDGEEYAVGGSFTPTGDVTVKAVWISVIAAEVREGTLSYQIHIPIPAGARLLAAGYSGGGRLLWTRLLDSPQAAGELAVDSAERYRLFLLQGDDAAPLCRNWDSLSG